MENKTTFFWFRRDLRLEDNVGLHHALKASNNVKVLFIFDDDILSKLPKDDARVSFIYETLSKINNQLNEKGSSVLVKHGSPLNVWKSLVSEYDVVSVYANKDYEPYGIKRDLKITSFFRGRRNIVL
jgi:deoxyribodipyrimidine photo-lyase